jgi:acyl dehydratase
MEHSGRDRFERYLEDFHSGNTFIHWPGRTITEATNASFCYWTMNKQPLHLDAEYARSAGFGQPLVNGLLVLSIAVGLSIDGMSGAIIANLGYDQVAHDGPVFIGDTVYAESTVLDVRSSSSRLDRGIVHVETRAKNQHGDRVLTFSRHFMVPTRERGAP